MCSYEHLFALASRCSAINKARLYRFAHRFTMNRKVNEHATFCVPYKNQFHQCLLCERIFTSNRQYSLKRHYNTCHKDVASLPHSQKIELFNNKKNALLSDAVPDECTENRYEIKKASFVVALFLARQCRPYQDGQFFKSLGKEFFSCFGAEGKRICEILDSVPISRRTITRRTEIIAKYIFSQVKAKLDSCEFYSISLDESTDMNNIGQLIIFVKTVNKNFEIYEELLSVVAFHGNVTGETLFDAVEKHVFSLCSPNKLGSICTDGAKNMVGCNKGLVGYLKKKGINVPTFHCIIHQHALYAKELNLVKAMDIAVKIINKIKGGHHALTHRKFKGFLEDLSADYGDLCMYTEVRWLSRGKSLERLLNLRQEVQLFLEESKEQELADAMKNEDFLSELSFLCDITSSINELNLALQGENKNITDLLICSRQFEQKLKLLLTQLKNQYCSSLNRTTELLDQTQNPPFRAKKINEFTEIVNSLLKNFQSRFKDFEIIKNLISIHNDPMNSEYSTLSPEIREELERMRTDFHLPIGNGRSFWKDVSAEKYPKIRSEVMKLYCMFGSTYNCEAAFSKMKLIQTQWRNSISDQHLQDLIRIKLYKKEINVDDLVK